MSCRLSSLISLIQTLLLSLKFATLSWPALFPGCTAHSVFITIKQRGIQEYATRLSLENPTPLVIYASNIDSNALCRCYGTPKPGRACTEHWLASLLEGPDLDLIHFIDLRVIPNTRVKQRTLPDPRFFRDCISALQVADYLASFTCTIGSALAPLLPFIQSKSRLHTLRIEAHLTEEQTKLVCQLRGLHSVTLENASSAVMNALPNWAESLKTTLKHLTIHVSRFHASS